MTGPNLAPRRMSSKPASPAESKEAQSTSSPARRRPSIMAVVEKRPVGRDLGPQAAALDGPDHAQDVRVGRRLAEAREHDRLQVGKGVELGHELLE